MPAYKAQFAFHDQLELDFFDREGNLLGSLKIKPSTILWKPLGGQLYRSVSLENTE